MPQSWDMGQILSLPLRRKACGRFFRCPKNPTTSAGLEPANLGTRGQHANHYTTEAVDSCIKRDQLDVTCYFISLFYAQHVSYVKTSILRSLRLICWVISWVVLLCYDACTIVPSYQSNTTHEITPTRIVPEQYNPWNNSTYKSQAPEDGCINIRNMFSSK